MNPMRWMAQKLGAQQWLPRFAPVIVGSDKALQRITRGRLTIMLATGLDELVLQVPGRRSGVLRTTPLLTVPHHDAWYVVGSNWGAPKPPDWVGNLRAAQDPTITFRGRTIAVDAREVVGAERERIWPVLLETWPNYAKYAERTDRVLPVFRLTPR